MAHCSFRSCEIDSVVLGTDRVVSIRAMVHWAGVHVSVDSFAFQFILTDDCRQHIYPSKCIFEPRYLLHARALIVIQLNAEC